MRESGPAFFTALVIHALAMGFVVGINIALSLRLTGFANAIPLNPLHKFYPLHWLCVALIIVSGLALLLAYPAKALTNPVFYIKLVALSLALSISYYFQIQLRQQIAGAHSILHSKLVVNLAFLTLILWVITITAGRFLAYTNSVLLASHLL